jgi:hypothetical protein
LNNRKDSPCDGCRRGVPMDVVTGKGYIHNEARWPRGNGTICTDPYMNRPKS